MAVPVSKNARRRSNRQTNSPVAASGDNSPNPPCPKPVIKMANSGLKSDEVMESQKVRRKKGGNGLFDGNLLRIVSMIFGVTMMLILAMLHVIFLATLHENHIWFSNIKPLEREISFRTESGLYYSYYKQLVQAPHFTDELGRLTRDNVTEHGRTINILERFNIYQEVALAAVYRAFNIKTEPIFFYLYSIFGLQGLLIAAIYATSWTLSGSWVAACITAVSYTMNRADTTRVNYTAPLRESFALPFLWLQVFFITCHLRHDDSSRWKRNVYLTLMALTQFIFILFWQFAQFIFLLQALALFGAALVGLVTPEKVLDIFRVKFVMVLLACAVQFGNAMVLTSLVMAFIPAALLVLAIKGDGMALGRGIMKNMGLTVYYIALSLVLTSLINRIVRYLVHHRSDTHVFQFVLHKLGFSNKSNFDAMLYVCTGAFDWLTWDTYERLYQSWLFPLYAAGHLWLIYTLIRAVFTQWGKAPQETEEKSEGEKKVDVVVDRTMDPGLAFHTVLAVLFALMGISTLRFKYLWTVYMCIYAGYAATHRELYRGLLKCWKVDGWALETIRHGVAAMLLTAIVLNNMPAVKRELNDLREFYDPDTVTLMEWISNNTPSNAAFSGSMQLLAGVKLCTGRPLTNHPHYEDHQLRERTKTLYAYYGRTAPDQMYATLVQYNVSYFILEDSICLAKSTGCRVPDLVDMHRGQIPDNGENGGGLLAPSTVPRFCHEIRYGKPDYVKYFTLVFSNKTFRVYKVNEPKNDVKSDRR